MMEKMKQHKHYSYITTIQWQLQCNDKTEGYKTQLLNQTNQSEQKKQQQNT